MIRLVSKYHPTNYVGGIREMVTVVNSSSIPKKGRCSTNRLILFSRTRAARCHNIDRLLSTTTTTSGCTNHKKQEVPTLPPNNTTIQCEEEDPFVLNPPILKHIPSLPILGSMVPWYSNIPLLDGTNDRERNLIMREKFGNFFTCGLPGMGTGINGTVYCKY
jgi:hypothetical protein